MRYLKQHGLQEDWYLLIEKLFDILKTIGKKYDVQILVQSRKVYTEYFSGSIDTNLTLDEILSYLDVDNKFMWRKKGKTIVITDR